MGMAHTPIQSVIWQQPESTSRVADAGRSFRCGPLPRHGPSQHPVRVRIPERSGVLWVAIHVRWAMPLSPSCRLASGSPRRINRCTRGNLREAEVHARPFTQAPGWVRIRCRRTNVLLSLHSALMPLSGLSSYGCSVARRCGVFVWFRKAPARTPTPDFFTARSAPSGAGLSF